MGGHWIAQKKSCMSSSLFLLEFLVYLVPLFYLFLLDVINTYMLMLN